MEMNDMTAQATRQAASERRRSKTHPLAPHEKALLSLIRLSPPADPLAREELDKAVRAAYDAAIHAATVMCHRAGFRPAEERAPDAVHELFCQLRPHAARGYRPESPFYPYVFAALQYIVWGMAREEQRHAAGLPVARTSNEGENDPSRAAELIELAELVRNLPSGLRDAVLLRYFGGHSSKEAAAILSVSTNAVDLRTHRALRHLRHKLD